MGRNIKKFLLIIILSFSFCGEEKVKESLSHSSICKIENFNSSCWRGRNGEKEIVASINNVPISKELLLRTISQGDFSSPKQALDFLIKTEIISQKAFKDGYYKNEILLDAYKRALVQTFLVEKFEINLNESHISYEFLKDAFEKNPLIKMKYDHLDWFSIQTLEWICCRDGSKECQLREQNCFEEAFSQLQFLYEGIKERVVDEDSLKKILEEIKPKFEKVNYREYQFFYDAKVPYEKQRTWKIMDRAIVEACYSMKIGDLHSPVRTNFGSHIIYLRDFKAEERRSLDEEEVQKELRKLLLPIWRKKQLDDFLTHLKKKYDVKFFVKLPESVK